MKYWMPNFAELSMEGRMNSSSCFFFKLMFLLEKWRVHLLISYMGRWWWWYDDVHNFWKGLKRSKNKPVVITCFPPQTHSKDHNWTPSTSVFHSLQDAMKEYTVYPGWCLFAEVRKRMVFILNVIWGNTFTSSIPHCWTRYKISPLDLDNLQVLHTCHLVWRRLCYLFCYCHLYLAQGHHDILFWKDLSLGWMTSYFQPSVSK